MEAWLKAGLQMLPLVALEASADRDRPVETNLQLFRDMRDGKFPNGACVLRAKIDLASGNINLRDPVLYRILHATHHRTGDKWCIYPMYDWAHGQSDSIEGITHSICTLEFEDHKPLYNWFIESLGIYQPVQIEFARLNLNYTVLSKRKLIRLVQETQPDEIYNLAAQSHVHVSFETAEYTANADGVGALRIVRSAIEQGKLEWEEYSHFGMITRLQAAGFVVHLMSSSAKPGL